MPLRAIVDGRALAVVHHLKKFDSGDGTGTRGSSALMSFVDIVTEMRRYGKQGDDDDAADDRRRVLTSVSRWDETPRKLIIRMKDDGSDFVAEGDGSEVKAAKTITNIIELLPLIGPGATVGELHERLSDSVRPKRGKLMEILQDGAVAGRWHQGGSGTSADPRRFWRDPG